MMNTPSESVSNHHIIEMITSRVQKLANQIYRT